MRARICAAPHSSQYPADMALSTCYAIRNSPVARLDHTEVREAVGKLGEARLKIAARAKRDLMITILTSCGGAPLLAGIDRILQHGAGSQGAACTSCAGKRGITVGYRRR